MEIREYAEKVLKSLDIEGAEIKEVEKANGVVFTGIMVPTGNNVATNIYWERVIFRLENRQCI